ncbi:hypothetical protein LTR37_008461 [Vermiconidia calcicola]|uniref:Uncharacterized protein n=1 Tax=Vermiconidia calcicola TaxID=1690605 RepID=A0ACC3NC69_9PEZI|nr:hypothetical protein LTR37_008461 [Vermiconidia calcicola]
MATPDVEDEKAIATFATVGYAADGPIHSQTKTFPLLDLPPELWSRIVRLAVKREDRMLEPRDLLRLSEQVQQPAVTRVCKLLRRETLAHFYSRNSFTFKDDGPILWALAAWLEAIGTGNRTRIKNLSIVSNYGGVEDELEGSSYCSEFIKIRSSQILDARGPFGCERTHYWVEVLKPAESLMEPGSLGVVEEAGVPQSVKRIRRL